MKVDYLSFRIATSKSLIGLVVQAMVGLGLLVFSRLYNDQAAFTASLYVLSGIVVWLALTIVFDQHRRERIEALEQERLDRTGGHESSVFEAGAQEMRVAAKRLAWMHRWMLPTVSLLLAAGLATLGWRRLAAHWTAVAAANKTGAATIITLSETERGWAIAIGIGMAIIGFAFARYIAGMAKQPIWANLRAGSGQAAGAALMGLAIVVAHAVDVIGPDTILRNLDPGFAIAMLFFAAEIVLNFVLTIYRPRRPGEYPRPAFDSRVLSFVAAPDRIAESISDAINYQFGYDVSSSWFYQLLTRRLTALLALGTVVVWLMTTLTVVQPNEQGLRLRNGELVGAALGPGAYLKLPWPLERIERFPTTSIRTVDLASPPPGNVATILWTNDHKVVEKYVVVQPPSIGGAAGVTNTDDQSETGSVRDLALLSVEVRMYYVIDDLRKFAEVAPEDMREPLLRAVGRREVLKYLATKREDELLGNGRATADEELFTRVKDAVASLRADNGGPGVRILSVEIEGVHPPKDTAPKFEEVVSNEAKRQANIESAQAKRVETLTKSVGSVNLAERIVAEIGTLEQLNQSEAPRAEVGAQELLIEQLLISAGGEAATMIQQAKADRWAQHMGARGRAERYAGQLQAFRAAPAAYAAELYFDMWKEVLGKARVYITSDPSRMQIRTDLKDLETGGNPLLQAPPPEESQ